MSALALNPPSATPPADDDSGGRVADQNGAASADIVPLDPAQPFAPPKPVIADLLRTRYCIPGSVFLVEWIDPCVAVGGRGRRRLVRLLLGDGELCVQALLAAEMHGFVDDGQVFVGCYVRVDRFEARWVGGGGGGGASPGDEMVYLLVRDLVAVGRNTRYLQMVEEAGARQGGRSAGTEEGTGAKLARTEEDRSDAQALGRGSGQIRNEASSPEDVAKDGQADEGVAAWGTAQGRPHRESATVPGPGGRGLSIAESHGSESAGPPAESDPSRTSLVREQTTITAAETHQVQTNTGAPAAAAAAAAAADASTSALSRRDRSRSSVPWSVPDPTQPLKLTPLRLIPHLPYKQNWSVNVLAVVASLSDVEPSHLPPYHQRTARLADRSTAKRVLLTVFLDPDDFAPAVGSVVLLLGVKNHRFDGGSLKKYASDRPRGGARWWFEEPRELGWCDVAGLRAWWDGRRGEEARGADIP